MRIVKRGNKHEPKIFGGSCRECGSVVEYQEDEVKCCPILCLIFLRFLYIDKKRSVNSSRYNSATCFSETSINSINSCLAAKRFKKSLNFDDTPL